MLLRAPGSSCTACTACDQGTMTFTSLSAHARDARAAAAFTVGKHAFWGACFLDLTSASTRCLHDSCSQQHIFVDVPLCMHCSQALRCKPPGTEICRSCYDAPASWQVHSPGLKRAVVCRCCSRTHRGRSRRRRMLQDWSASWPARTAASCTWQIRLRWPAPPSSRRSQVSRACDLGPSGWLRCHISQLAPIRLCWDNHSLTPCTLRGHRAQRQHGESKPCQARRVTLLENCIRR